MNTSRMLGFNFLSNPTNTLLLSGGNFDGMDALTSTITGNIIKGNLIYRHDRTPTATVDLIDECVTGGARLTFPSSNALTLFAYDTSGNRSQCNKALELGQSYDISFTADGSNNGSPVAILTVNGITTRVPSYVGLASTTHKVGNAGQNGVGKISKYVVSRDGKQLPEFIPSIYGIPGTTSAGNGWVLTDGSPLTFWS